MGHSFTDYTCLRRCRWRSGERTLRCQRTAGSCLARIQTSCLRSPGVLQTPCCSEKMEFLFQIRPCLSPDRIFAPYEASWLLMQNPKTTSKRHCTSWIRHSNNKEDQWTHKCTKKQLNDKTEIQNSPFWINCQATYKKTRNWAVIFWYTVWPLISCVSLAHYAPLVRASMRHEVAL